MVKVRPRLSAICVALCVALPISGCSPYSSVSKRLIRFQSETEEGRLLAKGIESRERPEKLLGHALDCAAAANRRLREKPESAAARSEYNFAVSRAFGALKDSALRPWEAPVRVHGREGDWLLTFKNGTQAEMEPGKVSFRPADWYAFRGSYVSTHSIKDGLGAPLIVKAAEQNFTQTQRFARNKNVYYGMTGLLNFKGRECVLTTEDPLEVERVKFNGRTYPLAADFTAPLAIALSKEKPFLFGLERLLRPQKYAQTARIARLQPYDPTKVPVICVHGLLDSPATWVPIINTLRGDEVIRRHYQFWFYSYPSGYPYPHSAAIMRLHLDAINELYPGHKKEILIGHSMGGIISRTMITDSGMRLWNAYFDQPPASLAISEASRQVLSDALIFRRRPEVGSVIFIASPHRGSDLASGWLGKLGSRLVKAPAFLLKLTEETRHLTTLDAAALRLGLMPNSIETLTPNDPFVRTIDSIPTVPGVPFHSIMGDRGKGGNKDRTKPVSTDGFVPYWSSHLDGAKSETIVPSGHSAHQNAQAIEKVRSILHDDARTSRRTPGLRHAAQHHKLPD